VLHETAGELFAPDRRLQEIGTLGANAMKGAPPRLKAAFWLDVALLISVCALEQIPFTGAIVHEWLGLAFGAMIVVHLLFAWTWIASQTRQLFPVQSGRRLINYVLNWCLFASVTAVIFSGIIISQEAIPALTKKRVAVRPDSPWRYIHDQGSNLVVALAGLHLALNWDWSIAAGRTVLRRGRAGTL
jgi:cytochrome b